MNKDASKPRAGRAITLKAYAKINLSLDILGRLPNGYHSIRTVMQQVDLFDTVSVSVREGGAGMRVTLSAEAEAGLDTKALPTDARNLALRAARAFLERYAPRFCGSVAIHLQKRIPLAAGLAGGSGNAAAVILALARLCPPQGMPLPAEPAARMKSLMELGFCIGADVPFCIMGQAALNGEPGLRGDFAAACALAEGMGERLTPLPSLRGRVIIAKPAAAVSTAAAYAGFDLSAVPAHPDTQALVAGIRAGDGGKVRKNMINVLEIPVLKEYPEIADMKETLAADKNAECALMSGSGSAVFAWYRDRVACETAFDALRRAKKTVWMADLL
ncbi:MAG: 4-(cytidine 5'-diphospho)-2-C-methyl-D-erythritol kinase [Clostridiales Family XIII bacterium]|jgi:4-diphosphocytidyl-2-C-methyl-D-erythritol kinase|nr:4-(cytidine 5'-diphospho)-2-C-methyl-D-erythritol kinase [Clostridiales Family XIII bacterium]